MRKNSYCRFFLTLSLGASLAGCNSETLGNTGLVTTVEPSPSSPDPVASAHPTPTPTGAIADPGTFDARKGFKIEIKPSGNYTYYLHQDDREGGASAGTTTATSPCAVPSLDPTPANNDIKCILEADELDLWYNGIALHFNVPYSMCTYFVWRPHWHYNWPIGKPDATALTKVIDNSVLPPTSTYKVDTGAGLAAVTAGNTNSFFDLSGEPTCAYPYGPYDFTPSTGPNCCMGTASYALTTIDVQDVAIPGPAVSPSPVATTTISEIKWGGNAGNCVAGPAVQTQGKSGDGLPVGTISLVAGSGVNTEYAPPIPGNSGLAPHMASFYLANYYDKSGAPYYAAAPTPFETPPNTSLSPAQAYYELSCLDPAYTTLARIRLEVRKWNLAEELVKYLADPTTGDCHTTAAVDPITGLPVDDFPSWDGEYVNPNLGGQTYPKLTY